MMGSSTCLFDTCHMLPAWMWLVWKRERGWWLFYNWHHLASIPFRDQNCRSSSVHCAKKNPPFFLAAAGDDLDFLIRCSLSMQLFVAAIWKKGIKNTLAAAQWSTLWQIESFCKVKILLPFIRCIFGGWRRRRHVRWWQTVCSLGLLEVLVVLAKFVSHSS